MICFTGTLLGLGYHGNMGPGVSRVGIWPISVLFVNRGFRWGFVLTYGYTTAEIYRHVQVRPNRTNNTTSMFCTIRCSLRISILSLFLSSKNLNMTRNETDLIFFKIKSKMVVMVKTWCGQPHIVESNSLTRNSSCQCILYFSLPFPFVKILTFSLVCKTTSCFSACFIKCYILLHVVLSLYAY